MRDHTPSERQQYDDFFITVESDAEKKVRLSVASPAGEGRDLLRFSMSDDELERLTKTPKAWRPGGHGKDGEALPRNHRQLGQELFDALFPSGLRTLLDQSLGQAEARRRGLRVRLCLDVDDPQKRRISALPWELLSRDRKNFLTLNLRTSLVRHLEVAKPAGDRPRLRELRILAVLANPEEQPALDLESEWRVLDEIWSEHPCVELIRLENPSLDTLLTKLEGGTFHALHFMGHGGYDPDQREWILCFCGENGGTDYVPASALGEVLADFDRPLRLVVLNACESARLGQHAPEGTSPGGGIAAALTTAGLPAVVAMQAPISDRAAIEFSKGLYHRLAAGDPLERAVTTARRRIRSHERRGIVKPVEWATPVVFLRTADSDLFEVAQENEGVAEPKNWHLSWLGLAVLTGGGTGLALLAGLGSLWIWDSPSFHYTGAVTGGALGGLGWLGRRLWILYESKARASDFSRVIAARPMWLALLFALPVLALGAWAGLGLTRLQELRCAPLGPLPPGVRRVALEPWRMIGATAEELIWSHELADELAEKLGRIENLQVLVWPAPTPQDFDRRCVDLTLSGRLWLDRGIHLRATLTDSQLRDSTVARLGQAEDFGDLDRLINGLILDMVDTLELELSLEKHQLLEVPTTMVPQARHLYRLGVLASLEGSLDEAESRFRDALLLDASYTSALNHLGLLLTHRGRPGAAIELFRRAIRIAPHRASYHFNLGVALEKSVMTGLSPAKEPREVSPLREVVEAYQKSIQLNPVDAQVYNKLGFTLLKLGELDRAREVLEGGWSLVSEKALLPVFEKNLGWLALEENAPEEALTHLNHAIRLRPGYAEAHYLLARSLERLARKRNIEVREACAAWRHYLEIAEDDTQDSLRRDALERLERLSCDN